MARDWAGGVAEVFCLPLWLCEAGMRSSNLRLRLTPPKWQCRGAFGLFVSRP